MVSTTSIDANGMKKGTWTEEEDNKLRAYIQRYGHWNWRQLPKFAGELLSIGVARCGKSCRLRWMNYLRPGLKRGKYTKEEEDLIVELHEKLGNKWSAIAAKLPGRSDNEIKNYWHTNLKGRMKKISAAINAIESPTEVRHQSEANQDENLPDISHQRELADENVAAEVSGSQGSEKIEVSTTHSCSEMSSSNSNLVPEDGISSWESFAEVESFWSEPFVLDTSYNHNNYLSSSFEEEGTLGSYFSYSEDSFDFCYQWMEDYP